MRDRFEDDRRRLADGVDKGLFPRRDKGDLFRDRNVYAGQDG
jgi:hypothetical protein